MRLNADYGIKEFNQRTHGGYDSDEYHVRVAVDSSSMCGIDFEYLVKDQPQKQCGGSLSLEFETARWLAFALLGATGGYPVGPDGFTATFENEKIVDRDAWSNVDAGNAKGSSQ